MNQPNKSVEELENLERKTERGLYWVRLDRAREILTTAIENARREERKYRTDVLKELIEQHGHQQEDGTIWCNMDELLAALSHHKEPISSDKE